MHMFIHRLKISHKVFFYCQPFLIQVRTANECSRIADKNINTSLENTICGS